MQSLRIFNQYERNIVEAYDRLTDGDRRGYLSFLLRAEEILKKADKFLSKKEYNLLCLCAYKTQEVLKRCQALGIKNLKRRLSEYRFAEIIFRYKKERTQVRREELRAEFPFLRAA